MNKVFSSKQVNSHFNDHVNQMFFNGGGHAVTNSKWSTNKYGVNGITTTSDITGNPTIDEYVDHLKKHAKTVKAFNPSKTPITSMPSTTTITPSNAILTTVSAALTSTH